MAFRIYSGVTPSGVAYELRNLVGDDQVTLTKEKNARDGSGFNKLLADCIKKIGDQNVVGEDFVKAMLTNDRRDMLVQLRQHSLKFKPTFDFTYDWPVKVSNTRKELQEYSVEFNEQGFARKPYAWVAEALAKLAADAAATGGVAPTKWPVLYSSYSEMLAEQATGRKYTTPESEEEITWELLTGAGERAIAEIVEGNLTSNTPLVMRKPKVHYQPTDPEARPVPTAWQPGQADLLDVEGFRHELRRVEGFIDTVLTIEHQTDPTRKARVDLVNTVDFFFPSRAI